MNIIINDQNGNEHRIHLYADEGEVKVSGWETFGGYDGENGGVRTPTKCLKTNHEEEGDNEWVFDIRDNIDGLVAKHNKEVA